MSLEGVSSYFKNDLIELWGTRCIKLQWHNAWLGLGLSLGTCIAEVLLSIWPIIGIKNKNGETYVNKTCSKK